ncbi:T9SS type A sorting domain-containing protein [bacterium]|nr:T9SS type A sorting domain-containing protein [bacterium]
MKYLILFLLILSTAFGQYVVTAAGGIVIELDTLDGFFGIGDTVGASGRKLMFDFGHAWSRKASHFIVMIDSVLYSNDETYQFTCGGIHLRPYSGPISTFYDGFATQWNIPMDTLGGAIILTQRLKAVIIDDAPAVEISYMFLNIDDVMHKIAFLQNIDVLVGSNDAAPIAMGGVYTDLGNVLIGDAVPYFWQAFERGPGAGSDQVVARGLLRGVAIKPDIFAFGHQSYLYSDCWAPDSDIVGRNYYDSGVTMVWDERQISPNKFAEVNTIYGFGEAPEEGSHYIIMPLIPNSVGSACDKWAQNPFEAAVLVHNLDLSPGIDSLMICLSLGEGLSVAIDPWHTLDDTCVNFDMMLIPDSTIMVNWLIEADTSYFTFGPTDVSIIARVTSSTSGFTDVEETTHVQIPDPVGVPPVVRGLKVPDHAVSCTGVHIHAKYLIEDDGGIDPASLIFQIGPYLKYQNDSMITMIADTALLRIPFYFLYHGNKIYNGVVAVSDSDGCIPDSIPVVSAFWVDLYAPVIDSPYPPDGSLIGDSLIPVILQIHDWPAGVDTSSIRLRVDIDGVRTAYSITSPGLSFVDSILTFDYGAPWPDSAEIEICLTQVWDRVDTVFCDVNAADTFCFSFHTAYTGIGETDRPLVFALNAHPNPFNADVSIAAPLATSLAIFDITGRPVRDLSAALSTDGNSVVVWDGRDSSGARLPSGVYFARAQKGESELVEKIVLIR